MKNKDSTFEIPKFKDLMQPILDILDSMGGSATIAELNEKVISSLNIPEDEAEKLYVLDKSGNPVIDTNLSFARSYLKKCGLLENSERGVWSLSPGFKSGDKINPDSIARKARTETDKKRRKTSTHCNDEDQCSLTDEDSTEWQEELRQVLLNIKPKAFERLTQLLLRELGFVQVVITGRSGDGGIDGKGIVKLQEILSFHVVFQCKRYKDLISSPAIRDFRGAMQGRAEKGLFITTGTFSSEAVKEATRDGAIAIDLVDMKDLALMFKNLNLGVNVKMVEKVTVDKGWFEKNINND